MKTIIATTENDDGTTSYMLPAPMRYRFTVSEYPDPAGGSDVPTAVVAAAIEALSALTEETHSALNDARFSEHGRHDKLAAPQAAAITGLALLAGQLDAFEDSVQRRLRDHLAVPPLGPGMSQAAFDDAELRRWWQHASTDDKSKVVSTAAADAQCERMLVALLRSPVPIIVTPEMAMVQEAFAAMRDAADPATADAIAGQRRGLDWGRIQLATIAAIAHQLVLTYGSRNRLEVLELLMEQEDERVRKGSDLYGYSRMEVGHAQRLVAMKAARAKERAADAAARSVHSGHPGVSWGMPAA